MSVVLVYTLIMVNSIVAGIGVIQPMTTTNEVSAAIIAIDRATGELVIPNRILFS